MTALDEAKGAARGVAGRARRAARALAGHEALEARVAELEREVNELRSENLRLAELTDVVTELLVPLASRDQAKIDAALAAYPTTL